MDSMFLNNIIDILMYSNSKAINMSALLFEILLLCFVHISANICLKVDDETCANRFPLLRYQQKNALDINYELKTITFRKIVSFIVF